MTSEPPRMSADSPGTRPRNVRAQSKKESKTESKTEKGNSLSPGFVASRPRADAGVPRREKEIDRVVVEAARDAVERMRRMWPAHRWGEPGDPHNAAREYGEALLDVGDAGAIVRGTTAAIRSIGGRFPPPVADLLAYVRHELPPPERPPVPENPPNRCPICAEQGETNAVTVDPETGIASCVEGLHRMTWRAW